MKPSSFKEYFYTTIIEKIIAGVALSNKLRLIVILLIVIILIAAINLIITLKASGLM